MLCSGSAFAQSVAGLGAISGMFATLRGRGSRRSGRGCNESKGIKRTSPLRNRACLRRRRCVPRRVQRDRNQTRFCPVRAEEHPGARRPEYRLEIALAVEGAATQIQVEAAAPSSITPRPTYRKSRLAADLELARLTADASIRSFPGAGGCARWNFRTGFLPWNRRR